MAERASPETSSRPSTYYEESEQAGAALHALSALLELRTGAPRILGGSPAGVPSPSTALPPSTAAADPAQAAVVEDADAVMTEDVEGACCASKSEEQVPTKSAYFVEHEQLRGEESLRASAGPAHLDACKTLQAAAQEHCPPARLVETESTAACSDKGTVAPIQGQAEAERCAGDRSGGDDGERAETERVNAGHLPSEQATSIGGLVSTVAATVSRPQPTTADGIENEETASTRAKECQISASKGRGKEPATDDSANQLEVEMLRSVRVSGASGQSTLPCDSYRDVPVSIFLPRDLPIVFREKLSDVAEQSAMPDAEWKLKFEDFKQWVQQNGHAHPARRCESMHS